MPKNRPDVKTFSSNGDVVDTNAVLCLPRTRGVDQPFKEFKVITFYDEQGKHWHEVLSRSKRNGVGNLIRREAERLGFQKADERIANVDGASWIRTQLETQMPCLKLSGMGLDFYHLGENVHRCRRRVYGEDSAEGTAWADDIMHTFKHRKGYSESLGETRPRGEPDWKGRQNVKPGIDC